MASQKYPKSDRLERLRRALLNAQSKAEQDQIWNSIETPIIEDMPTDDKIKLVTFIYRYKHSEKPPLIYLYSAITDEPLSSKSQLLSIPQTDILYLTLLLPSKLRTTYNYLYVDKIEENIKSGEDSISSNFPVPTGHFKKAQEILSNLFAHDRVEIDPNNKNKIIYYIDYEKPEKFFGMESVLELPNAPKQRYMPSTSNLIKVERDKLKQENRFTDDTIEFSHTRLKDIQDYKNTSRNYWIFLPREYNQKQTYPLLLFLDGSDFINTIPAPSILNRLIDDKSIQPSIAVFFDYSMEMRQQEYYCHEEFTQFIANDFISHLRNDRRLAITYDPKLMTIIGISASGLAAFYSGLTHPNVFGNVITFSASFESIKKTELNKLIDKNISKMHQMFFYIEAGSYETTPIELQFPDNSKQSLSVLQANKNVVERLKEYGVNVYFKEFIGGHNYVCWRSSLVNGLKQLYASRSYDTI